MKKYDVPPREDLAPLEWMRKAARAFENEHAGSLAPRVGDPAGIVEDLRELQRYRAEITPEESELADEGERAQLFCLFVDDEEVRKRG